eukprot:5112237-Amphidinium_carterae.1
MQCHACQAIVRCWVFRIWSRCIRKSSTTLAANPYCSITSYMQWLHQWRGGVRFSPPTRRAQLQAFGFTAR